MAAAAAAQQPVSAQVVCFLSLLCCDLFIGCGVFALKPAALYCLFVFIFKDVTNDNLKKVGF